MLKETYYGFNRSNKKHIEKLQHVLSLQGPKRWRAAANLYLFLNPKSYAWDEEAGEMIVAMDAREEARIIAEQCAAIRQELEESHNKHGLSEGTLSGESGSRQYSLRMPATMLQFIQMIDPDLLEINRGQEGKELWRKLRNEFKEFQVSTL